MIDFGGTLRQARERKGLTTGQVAEATHMMVQIVEDLENEDFGRIAAPIYGRGFVKLYCEAVGIDAKPLVDEFMEIFNGNRPATIRRRGEPAPEPVRRPAAATSPSGQSSPAPAAEDVFASAPEPEDGDGIIPAAEIPMEESEGTPASAIEPPPAESLFDFARIQRQEPSQPEKPVPPPPTAATAQTALTGRPSRYSTPMPIDDEPHRLGFSFNPAIWRFLAIIAVAGVALWLLYAGVMALYRALTAPDSVRETPPETAKVAPATSAPVQPAAVERKPLDIPPLYID